MSIDKFAMEESSKTESIKDIVCPRNVLNPGLYFGIMKGYKYAMDRTNQPSYKRRTVEDIEASIIEGVYGKVKPLVTETSNSIKRHRIMVEAMAQVMAGELFKLQQAVFPAGTLPGDPLTDHQYFERTAVDLREWQTKGIVKFQNEIGEMMVAGPELLAKYIEWRKLQGRPLP